MSYPRVSCYAWNSGFGYPWTTTKAQGAPLNLDVIVAAARYPMLTADIAPVFDPDPVTGRPDISAAIRRANPKVKLGIYQCLGWTYMDPTYGDLPDWTRRVWLRALKETNGIGPGGMIRWEQPETERRLTEALVAVWHSHRGDFFFFDFCWTNSMPGTRAMQRCIHALKEAGCPVVIGNSEVLDKPPSAFDTEGCMQENWPNFPIDPHNIRLWRSGRPRKSHDWLQGGTGYANLDTPDAQRACRYLHGMACMEGMIGSFGPDRDQGVTPPYCTWWQPFYDASGLGTGWLGEPLGPAQASDVGSIRRLFANGLVEVNTGSQSYTVNLPKGLCRFDGTEMGSVTVPAKDAVFLVRAR